MYAGGFVAQWPKEDGTSDAALAYPENDTEGFKVIVFPEPGGQYEIYHSVPEGNEPGQVHIER